MTDQTEKPNDGGRPPVLDDNKRRKIIAIIANGSSRRVAARIVGCAHSTITRTAVRDPEFAVELDAAEHSAEVEALRNLRHAARTDRYWRAAAWLLERKNPQEFAARGPTVLSLDQICALFIHLTRPIVSSLSDTDFDRLLVEVTECAEAAQGNPAILKLLRIPAPPPPAFDPVYGPQSESFAPQTPDGGDDRDGGPSSQALDMEQLGPDPGDPFQRQS
jgi:hypothetical protein